MECSKSQWVLVVLCQAQSGLESDFFDVDKHGTGGLFLTLEQDGETNTFCLLAEAITINRALSAKALLVPGCPTQWQAWLG